MIASDIDVMVITGSSGLLLGRKIHKTIRDAGGGVIQGSRVGLQQLCSYRTLVHFEAKHAGYVADGDHSVLECIRMANADDIPTWEAVRLLLNRVFAYLEFKAGELDGAQCAAKLYEAMGDSLLLLDGRYHPSFASRLEAMTKTPVNTAAVPHLVATYKDVVRARLGGPSAQVGRPETAVSDLISTLEHVLRTIHQCDSDLDALMSLTEREHRNLRQRAYWLAVTTAEGRPCFATTRVDPAFIVWRNGIAHTLDPALSARAASKLVKEWKRCPKPFVR